MTAPPAAGKQKKVKRSRNTLSERSTVCYNGKLSVLTTKGDKMTFTVKTQIQQAKMKPNNQKKKKKTPKLFKKKPHTHTLQNYQIRDVVI